MWLQLINVVYVLVAISMVVLILMQRGAGAQAGSGFGGGASSTVFGSRGSSNFLTKSTKWLGILFFVIAMGMAMYASKSATGTLDAKPRRFRLPRRHPRHPPKAVDRHYNAGRGAGRNRFAQVAELVDALP